MQNLFDTLMRQRQNSNELPSAGLNMNDISRVAQDLLNRQGAIQTNNLDSLESYAEQLHIIPPHYQSELLIATIEKKNSNALRQLLNNGAQPLIPDSKGTIPMLYAIEQQCDEQFKIMLEKEGVSDQLKKDVGKYRPFQRAIDAESPTIQKFCLKNL